MKKYLLLLAAACLLCAYSPAFADDAQQVITLKDGSQIKGVLSGIQDGVYTVKTPIIGDVHVNANDVASITNGNAAGPALPAASQPVTAPNPMPSNMDQQIDAQQKQLMSNPQSMALLMQMAQNPEIAQALQDPALVQAVTNHDYAAVQNNPGVQKLMNDPQMQALMKKLASQQTQQNASSQ